MWTLVFLSFVPLPPYIIPESVKFAEFQNHGNPHGYWGFDLSILLKFLHPIGEEIMDSETAWKVRRHAGLGLVTPIWVSRIQVIDTCYKGRCYSLLYGRHEESSVPTEILWRSGWVLIIWEDPVECSWTSHRCFWLRFFVALVYWDPGGRGLLFGARPGEMPESFWRYSVILKSVLHSRLNENLNPWNSNHCDKP